MNAGAKLLTRLPGPTCSCYELRRSADSVHLGRIGAHWHGGSSTVRGDYYGLRAIVILWKEWRGIRLMKQAELILQS